MPLKKEKQNLFIDIFLIRTLASTVLSLVILLFLSCDLDVPVDLLSKAKSSISRAVEVKAEKYAQIELIRAKEYLLIAHKELIKGDTDRVKENARESIRLSKEAIDKSLPLLSRDTLEEAKNIYNEADLLNSEKYAAQEFTDAGNMLNSAEIYYKSNTYWDSYKFSIIVIEYASQAKKKSAEHIPELKQKIDSILSVEKNLTNNRGMEFAKDELDNIVSKLDSALKDIENSILKGVEDKIANAEGSMNNAKVKIFKGIAGEHIENSDNMLFIINSSKLKKKYQADIDKSIEILNKGKELYNANKFQESIPFLEKAVKMLEEINSIIRLMQDAADRIEAAQSLLDKIIKLDKKKTFMGEVASTMMLIEKSRMLYDNSSYQESIESSEAALEILNSIIIELEKKLEEDRLSRKSVDENIYVVKLDRRKRDCLWRIAKYVYGNPRLWPLIYVANKKMIKDPDLIFPGQKFIIPPVPEKGVIKYKNKTYRVK